MSYYFTADADGTKIDGQARFKRADSVPEMVERLQDGQKDLLVYGVQVGDFGDCWAKFIDRPDADTLEHLAAECGLPVQAFDVRAPGTHPGGRMWWVDVNIPVYVPVYHSQD